MGNKTSKFLASDTVIAVIGASGSGKSTFINTVTAVEHPLKIGAGLSPCTKHIQYIPYAPEPGSDGRIIFVDTPAFPDPEPKKGRSRQEEMTRIENAIKEWLEKNSGREHVQVNGVLYLYKIDQNRMTDPPRLHFEMFKKLWGNDYTGRVLLVATMSENVKEEVRKHRKAELISHWGGMVVEHDGTMETGRCIVDTLLHPPAQEA